MAKKSVKRTVVSKCQCSTCGQVANAQPNTEHVFCKGIHQNILARVPAMFKDLTNPSKKGKWVPWVEPPKPEPIVENVEAPTEA